MCEAIIFKMKWNAPFNLVRGIEIDLANRMYWFTFPLTLMFVEKIGYLQYLFPPIFKFILRILRILFVASYAYSLFILTIKEMLHVLFPSHVISGNNTCKTSSTVNWQRLNFWRFCFRHYVGKSILEFMQDGGQSLCDLSKTLIAVKSQAKQWMPFSVYFIILVY